MRRRRRRRHSRVSCGTRRTEREEARWASCRDLSRESLRCSSRRRRRCTAGPLSGPKEINPMSARPNMSSPRKSRGQDLAAGPATPLETQGALPRPRGEPGPKDEGARSGGGLFGGAMSSEDRKAVAVAAVGSVSGPGGEPDQPTSRLAGRRPGGRGSTSRPVMGVGCGPEGQPRIESAACR